MPRKASILSAKKNLFKLVKKYSKITIAYLKYQKWYYAYVLGLGLILPFLFLYLISQQVYGGGDATGFAAFVVLTTSIISFFRFLYLYIRSCFIGQFSERLKVIVHVYFGLLITFSGLYFMASTWHDLRYSVVEIEYYQYGFEKAFPKKEYLRNTTFNGMDSYVWTNLTHLPIFCAIPYRHDDNLKDDKEMDLEKFYKKFVEEYGYNIITLANKDILINHYGNCLFFSFITLTTFGYETYEPGSLTCKLISCLEILSGVSVFVFALGLITSEFNSNAKS